MPLNPFIHGAPIPPAAFIGRRKEVRRLVGRILNQGQSSALVGEPRLGKTSLLNYLRSPEHQNVLYGAEGKQLLFSFCDTQTFGTEFTTTHFWRQALQPIKTQLIDNTSDSPLAKSYQNAQRQGFDSFRLETFFQQLRQLGYRLVLLIDEFDTLLHHPKLNRAEFFGGLRSLASNSQGTFAVVIASRTSLAQLNAATQKINPTGSPFFNIFAEVTLGALPEADIEEVLTPGKIRFSADDQRYICRLAGGHPYLLQSTASLMWEAYEEGLTADVKRHRYVFETLCKDHDHHFADTWRNWRPEVRQAFTLIALLNAKEQIFKDRQLEINTLLESLPNLRPELSDLESAGLLLQNAAAMGGWRVTQGIMNVWLIDRLIHSTRTDDEFGQWLRKFEVEGLWTKGQRQQMQGYAQSVARGATNLMEKAIMAYSAGSAMS